MWDEVQGQKQKVREHHGRTSKAGVLSCVCVCVCVCVKMNRAHLCGKPHRPREGLWLIRQLVETTGRF